MTRRPRPNVRRARGLAPLALALLWVTACGPGLSGTYTSDDGLGSLEFRQRGRVYVTFAGSTFAGEYELDGDRVIIAGPGGSHVCTRRDGSIEGFGTTFLEE